MGNGFRNWLRRRREGAEFPKLDDYDATKITLNPEIFGNGLEAMSMPVSFVFEGGGVGDYINWCSSIKFIHETYPQVDGRIFTSELFLEVAQYLFKDYPRWIIANRSEFTKYHVQGSLVAHPKRGSQLLNACGAHLMDLAFHYFSCTNPPPEKYNYLLDIHFEGKWKWPELDPDSRFAVFTPGSTTDVREMPVKPFNELVRYTLKQGVTPVFLGKRDLSEGYQAKFLNYDLTNGIDLRERTSLLQATQIMRKARFVIGLDNGLLHMAGTTNVPVIFGHNITAIHHRDLRRKAGLTVNITADQRTIPCIGCQSKMRFLYKHDFRNCVYKESYPELEKRCLPAMFKDDSAEWKKAIDHVLEKGDKTRGISKNLDIYVR